MSGGLGKGEGEHYSKDPVANEAGRLSSLRWRWRKTKEKMKMRKLWRRMSPDASNSEQELLLATAAATTTTCLSNNYA